MNKTEYANEVARILSNELDAVCQVKTVMKNNETEKTGIMVTTNTNTNPVLYIDELYDSSYSVEEACDKLLDTIDLSGDTMPNADAISQFVKNFESVRDSLTCRLINLKKNQEYLSDKPYRQVNDLALTYQIDINSIAPHGVIQITNSLMDMWEATEEDLFNIVSNGRLNETEITDFFIPGMDGADFSSVPFKILSTPDKMYGAIGMLNTDLLDSYYGGQSVFIIPSSVHECLLLPDNGNCDSLELEAIIRDVNSTQVTPDEVLSDHAYYYDSNEKTVCCA